MKLFVTGGAGFIGSNYIPPMTRSLRIEVPGAVPTARCYKHDDLLVETPQANLSLGMRQLNGRYTQDYNRRHAEWGI